MNIVLGNIANTSSDNMKLNFAIRINQLQTINHRRYRTLNVSLNDYIKFFRIKLSIHHLKNICASNIGCGCHFLLFNFSLLRQIASFFFALRNLKSITELWQFLKSGHIHWHTWTGIFNGFTTEILKRSDSPVSRPSNQIMTRFQMTILHQ